MSEDNTITAKIKINVKGTSGKVKTIGSSKKKSGLLKSISSKLKNMLGIKIKSNKLLMSGIKTSKAGGLLGAIATGLAITTGLIASASIPGATADFEQWQDYLSATDSSLEKVQNEGKEYIAVINNQTGEITHLLTKQEAFEKELIDNKSEIVEHLKNNKETQWDLLSEQEQQLRILKKIITDSQELSKAHELNSEKRKEVNDALRKLVDYRNSLKDSLSKNKVDWGKVKSEIEKTKRVKKNIVRRNAMLYGSDKIANIVKNTPTPSGVSQFDISKLEY
jgi:Spy/CpxP family protein refolding chaperone